MTIAEKLVKVAENQQKVFDAGGLSQSIVKKQQGKGIIHIDDAVSITHKIKTQIINQNENNIELRMFGSNLFNNDTSLMNVLTYVSRNSVTGQVSYRNGYDIYLPCGEYTIQLIPKKEMVEKRYIYGCIVNKEGKTIKGVNTVAGTTCTPVTFDIGEGDILKIYDGNNYTTEENSRSKLQQSKLFFNEFDIMLNVGNEPLPYEPYIEPTIYIPNEDGIIDNIESVYPVINLIATDYSILFEVEYYQDGIKAGKEAEWNKFWDTFQDYGKKRSYTNAFYSKFWTNDNFHPKYDLAVKDSGKWMFQDSLISKIRKVKLDLTECTSVDNMFYRSAFEELPELNISNPSITKLTSMFNGATKLQEIKKLILGENQTFENIFTKCSSLKYIEIEGAIARDIDFSPCYQLTITSIINIIQHLKNYKNTTEENNYTIKFHTDSWTLLNENNDIIPDDAFETWKDYIQSIGWKTA